MVAALAEIWALPGLWAVLAIAFLAGLTYGFAGFGGGFVYMPLMTVFVEPRLAVAGLVVASLSSPVTVLPRAWAEADRRASLQMLAGALVTAPLGVAVLAGGDPVQLRWAVSGLIALVWLALAAGWRMRAMPGTGIRIASGAATGLIGGATGLTAAVVAVLHLAGTGGARRTRADTLVFLTLLNLGLLPLMLAQGLLERHALAFGAVQLLPYAAGARLGQALFRPEAEALYRRVALGLIALAVLAGLPITR